MNHIFIQARIGSKRLPGKVLKKICGKSIIELIVERVSKVEHIDKIVIVTGPKEKNELLINEIKKLDVNYFCGSEENVLDRFYKASLEFKSDNIIRVTADCPLIDFNVINKGFSIFKQNNYDILSNNRIRTYPHGLEFEIFQSDALKIARNDNFSLYKNYEEFYDIFIPPTKYMLEKKKFRNFDLLNDINISHIRVTLDYIEDLELITKIYDMLYNKNLYFGLDEIVSLLENNPSLQKINQKYAKFDSSLRIEK
jgi:spore coat polysaccharide biosynthesis protein SpsF